MSHQVEGWSRLRQQCAEGQDKDYGEAEKQSEKGNEAIG